MNYPTLFLITLAFTIVSIITVYFSTRSPLVKYFLDEPDKRKMHQLQIPRIGGFAILIAYAIVLGIFALTSPELLDKMLLNDTGKAVGYAALLVFILGFFDDTTFVTLNVPIKFGMQFAVALGVVYLFKINFEEIYIFGKMFWLGEFGKVLTVFWIVGVTNSLNIIDGIDGLSASVTLVSLGIASMVLAFTGHTEILFVIAPLIGIILGFLYHNYPPARLFAGDTGSLFFGSIVAIFSVRLMSMGTDQVDSLSGIYLAAFPVIEVFVSMFRRFTYGQRKGASLVGCIKEMVTPDNLHMHHRLIFKGFSHEQALRFLIFFATSISVTAIILVLTEDPIIKGGAIIYSFVIIALVLKRLDYGKSQFLGTETGETIRRVIAITGDSDYFEHSLRHFARTKYWIARFQKINDIIGRRVDAFVVYNESEETLKVDIKRALEVRDMSERALFFISDHEQCDIPQLQGKQVYFIKKPVDMPYLIHDIEKILSYGEKITATNISETLSVEAEHVANN